MASKKNLTLNPPNLRQMCTKTSNTSWKKAARVRVTRATNPSSTAETSAAEVVVRKKEEVEATVALLPGLSTTMTPKESSSSSSLDTTLISHGKTDRTVITIIQIAGTEVADT